MVFHASRLGFLSKPLTAGFGSSHCCNGSTFCRKSQIPSWHGHGPPAGIFGPGLNSISDRHGTSGRSSGRPRGSKILPNMVAPGPARPAVRSESQVLARQLSAPPARLKFPFSRIARLTTVTFSRPRRLGTPTAYLGRTPSQAATRARPGRNLK